jgi:hypothetical protein
MTLVGNTAGESKFIVDLKSPLIEFDGFFDIPGIPDSFKYEQKAFFIMSPKLYVLTLRTGS